MIHQAYQLLDAGYYVAAVATARCELECRMRMPTRVVADASRSHLPSRIAGKAACYLVAHGVISVTLRGRADGVAHRVGRMIHHFTDCNYVHAHWAIIEIERIIAELDDCMAARGHSVYERRGAFPAPIAV